MKAGISGWRKTPHLCFTSLESVYFLPCSLLPSHKLRRVPLCLSLEQTFHSSPHILSLDPFLHTSDGGRQKRRKRVGEVRFERQTPLNPTLPRLCVLLHCSCCRKWVVLTFPMNYQWIDCVLTCRLLMEGRLSMSDVISLNYY